MILWTFGGHGTHQDQDQGQDQDQDLNINPNGRVQPDSIKLEIWRK